MQSVKLNKAVIGWSRSTKEVRVFEHLSDECRNAMQFSTVGAVYSWYQKATPQEQVTNLFAEAACRIIYDDLEPKAVYRELSKVKEIRQLLSTNSGFSN